MSTTVGFPATFWLEDWGKQAILDFHLQYPVEGYRRLTFMMLDRNPALRDRRQPRQRLARAPPSWPPVALEPEALEEGHRVRAAAGAP